MPEYVVLEYGAGESGEDSKVLPAAFFGGDGEQPLGDDVDVASHIHRHVLEVWVVGDRHIGGDGPGRGGPDQAVDFTAGQRRMDFGRVRGEREPHPDGWAVMVL